MEEICRIDTVDQYNHLFGLETLHPLVAVVDISKGTRKVNHIQINYGLYALFLKENRSCDIMYGRQPYDYEDGTIVCFAPGQVVTVNMREEVGTPKAIGLLFHPDLIKGTSLGKKIDQYHFFSYAVNEALHLSEQEREIITDCFRKITIELEHAIDKHSTELIVMNIELLLGYCVRFYERQFHTRNQSNKSVIVRFEKLLDAYFHEGTAQHEGLPSVRYFADKICLSPNYFGDLIKKETGKTASEYIQTKLMDVAKEQIAGTDQTMSQIAYQLGFQYPQHFGRMFKQLVGCTPMAYRSGLRQQ